MISQEVLEQTRATVMTELERCKQKYRGDEAKAYGAFFNNFHLSLLTNSPEEGETIREYSDNSGEWTRTYKDLMADTHDDEDPEDVHTGPQVSTLRLNQTDEEFYSTVDRAVLDEGIPFHRMLRLQRTANKDPKMFMELMKLTLPVYVRLRAIGYNHYPDLTA